jgi:hypothetical protein
MVFIPSFVKIVELVQNRDCGTRRQHGDFISLLALPLKRM